MRREVEGWDWKRGKKKCRWGGCRVYCWILYPKRTGYWGEFYIVSEGGDVGVWWAQWLWAGEAPPFHKFSLQDRRALCCWLDHEITGYHFFVKITSLGEVLIQIPRMDKLIPQWCGHCSGGKVVRKLFGKNLFTKPFTPPDALHLEHHKWFYSQTSSGLYLNDLALPTCLVDSVQARSSSVQFLIECPGDTK